ncbi:MAG: hypothetical protein LKE41_03790 [Prevotella sp.]|nr:hypothetical protein [Prevotella sp.]
MLPTDPIQAGSLYTSLHCPPTIIPGWVLLDGKDAVDIIKEYWGENVTYPYEARWSHDVVPEMAT